MGSVTVIQMTAYERQVFIRTVSALPGKNKGKLKFKPIQRIPRVIIMLDPAVEYRDGVPRSYWEFNPTQQTLIQKQQQSVQVLNRSF